MTGLAVLQRCSGWTDGDHTSGQVPVKLKAQAGLIKYTDTRPFLSLPSFLPLHFHMHCHSTIIMT